MELINTSPACRIERETDPHWETADRLGVTREKGKRINFAAAYGVLRDTCPTTDPVALDNLIRCHRLCEIVSEPWDQAKSLEWTGLTQGQQYGPSVALATIEKFLPTDDRIAPSPIRDIITTELATARTFLRSAQGRPDKMEFLQVLEECLRAPAFIAKQYRDQQKETVQ